MAELWNPAADGVLRLPSGRLLRGRGLRNPMPEGPEPTFALYLLGKPPPEVAWESRWEHYSAHAVETFWQRRFVMGFR